MPTVPMGIRVRQMNLTYDNQNRPISFFYVLQVGPYQKKVDRPGDLWISSPAIRAIIRNHELKQDLVGHVTVMLNHDFKWVMTPSYEPTDRLDGLFAKKGIGDHLDLLLEKEFAKKFPNYHIRLTGEASRARKNQWIKRGRSLEDIIPLKTAIRQTRARVIANYQKNAPSSRRRKTL